jgi:hypothetical protein
MMLMLASVEGGGLSRRRTLWRQQRPCFAKPHAKARSYRRMTPSTTAHMHVVDVLNTGGASEGPYQRPHHTLLATKAYKYLYQTHVATTSKVTGLQRSALLSSTHFGAAGFCRLPSPHNLAFVKQTITNYTTLPAAWQYLTDFEDLNINNLVHVRRVYAAITTMDDEQSKMAEVLAKKLETFGGDADQYLAGKS